MKTQKPSAQISSIPGINDVNRRGLASQPVAENQMDKQPNSSSTNLRSVFVRRRKAWFWFSSDFLFKQVLRR